MDIHEDPPERRGDAELVEIASKGTPDQDLKKNRASAAAGVPFLRLVWSRVVPDGLELSDAVGNRA
eukprot:gene8748-22_t